MVFLVFSSGYMFFLFLFVFCGKTVGLFHSGICGLRRVFPAIVGGFFQSVDRAYQWNSVRCRVFNGTCSEEGAAAIADGDD